MFAIFNSSPFSAKKDYDLSSIRNVSIVIKTLERREQLVLLLRSIYKLGFAGPVLIADDSKCSYRQTVMNLFPGRDITYLVMPYDSGTSAGRNLMVEQVKTSFFVLCDDDFIFESRTRIPWMIQMMEENNLDILGGVFFQYNLKSRKGRVFDSLSKLAFRVGLCVPPLDYYEYFAGFDLDSDTVRVRKVTYHDPFTVCDLTHNFFVARTESVRSVGGWNNNLKGGEHQNFFIRAKMKSLRVATTRLSGIVHNRWTTNSAEYQALRNRGSAYQSFALEEFGFKRMEGFEEVIGEKFGG